VRFLISENCEREPYECATAKGVQPASFSSSASSNTPAGCETGVSDRPAGVLGELGEVLGKLPEVPGGLGEVGR
jgi:hypothetical protein